MATNNIPVGSFKPNSNKYKEQEAAKKKKHEPVTKSTPKIKKEDLASKFARAFIQEDIKSVKDYVIFENLIPEIKSIILNTLYDGLGLLFGITKRKTPGQKIDYANISAGYSYKSSGSTQTSKTEPVGKRTDYSSIVYQSKEDANNVLSMLQDLAKQYDTASVSDLFEIAGVSSNGFTDCYWVWTFDMLRFVPIRRVREGWILELPKPVSDE